MDQGLIFIDHLLYILAPPCILANIMQELLCVGPWHMKLLVISLRQPLPTAHRKDAPMNIFFWHGTMSTVTVIFVDNIGSNSSCIYDYINYFLGHIRRTPSPLTLSNTALVLHYFEPMSPPSASMDHQGCSARTCSAWKRGRDVTCLMGQAHAACPKGPCS